MRKELVAALEQELADNPKAIMIVGDLGFAVMEPMRKRFPKRFLNAGVAEGNMVGMAAGMALSGLMPICYSIGTFMAYRPFEQIRDDVCVSNLNVKMIGVGAGYGYSIYGPTHHSSEDIAVLRGLPNLTIVSPGDASELRGLTKAIFQHTGPVYIRIPRRTVAPLYRIEPRITLGKAIMVKQGTHAIICATGTMVERALEVAEALRASGKEIAVASFPTIKPINRQFIMRAAKQFPAIFVFEPHSIIGGLGSAIAEVVAQARYHGIFQQFGYRDQFIHYAASEAFLDKTLRLDAKSLVAAISKLII